MNAIKYRIVEVSEGTFNLQFKLWWWVFGWEVFTQFNPLSGQSEPKVFKTVHLAECWAKVHKEYYTKYPKVIKVIK